MSDLARMSLTEQLSGISAGKFTAADVLEACLAAIAAREAVVCAFATMPDLDEIRSRSSAQRKDGPLRGLPIAVKDTFDVAGMKAERGSTIYHGRVAVEDAAPVAMLRRQGGFVLGKTVTTEFAYFAPGRTANPHDLDHTPGGSSSGSAAAVATGMVPIALGSQTAASVVRPAAYCGTAAWVATRGLLALRGVLPLAQSFDSAGYFARAVGDLLLVHDLITGAAGFREPSRPKRLLVSDGSVFGPIDGPMLDAFENLLDALRKVGVVLLPFPTERASAWIERHKLLMAREAAQNFESEAARHADQLSPQFRDLLAEGRALSWDAWARLAEDQRVDAQWLAELFDGVDAIIAPAAPGPAPAGLRATGQPHMSRAWQLFGLPQCTFPFAKVGKLPLGVQIIGASNRDRQLLRTGSWMQIEFGLRIYPRDSEWTSARCNHRLSL
jgi:Asp-tRNA(Asn)/Glu-tRNA(Gln) amidotransferase A subunit family amidase